MSCGNVYPLPYLTRVLLRSLLAAGIRHPSPLADRSPPTGRDVVIHRTVWCKEAKGRGSPYSVRDAESMGKFPFSVTVGSGSILSPVFPITHSILGLLSSCASAVSPSPVEGGLAAATAAYVTCACWDGGCVRLFRRGHTGYM